MLTLKRLFLAKTHEQTMANVRDVRIDKKFAKHDYVPDDVLAIIRRALARDPDARYQSGREFVDAVLDYLFDHRLRVTSHDVVRFTNETLGTTSTEPITNRRKRPQETPSAVTPATPVRDLMEPPPIPIDSVSPKSGGLAQVDAAPLREAPLVIGNEPGDDDDGSLLVALESDLVDQVVAGHTPAQPLHTDIRVSDGPQMRVRDGSGTILGPMSVPTFQKLVRSRAVTSGEWVSVDNGRWRPVQRRHVSGALDAFTQPSTDIGTVVYEGKLERPWLPRLWLRLANAEATGMLRLKRDWITKDVFFKAGKIVHIRSNIKDELLASVLIANGFINEAQLNRGLSHATEHGVQLGEALVAIDAVTPSQLRHILRVQITARFIELFSWPHGSFVFVYGAKAPPYASEEGIGALALLGPAVRERYEPTELVAVLESSRGATMDLSQLDLAGLAAYGFEEAELEALKTVVDGTTLDAQIDQIDLAVHPPTLARALYLAIQLEHIKLV